VFVARSVALPVGNLSLRSYNAAVNRLVVVALVVLVLSAGPLEGVPAAHACSPDPDYNPAKSADLIVAGRVTGWREAGSEFGVPSPIVIQIAVDEVIKGPPRSQVDFIDLWSFDSRLGEQAWSNAMSPCGNQFGSDPTGDYLVMGLSESEDEEGTFYRGTVFFRGSDPKGGDYESEVTRIHDELETDWAELILRIGPWVGVGSLLLAMIATGYFLRRRGKQTLT